MELFEKDINKETEQDYFPPETNHKMIHLYKRKVHYYETDQMKIVHHSNYIRWFEEARVDFLEQIGFGYKRMESEGILSPVLSVACEYHSMVRFGDEIYIIPKIEEFNGIKFKITYQILDVISGELRTTGESKHCFLDTEYKPIRLKKGKPELYQLFLDYTGFDPLVMPIKR